MSPAFAIRMDLLTMSRNSLSNHPSRGLSVMSGNCSERFTCMLLHRRPWLEAAKGGVCESVLLDVSAPGGNRTRIRSLGSSCPSTRLPARNVRESTLGHEGCRCFRLLRALRDCEVRDVERVAARAVDLAGELPPRVLDLEREEQGVPALRARVLHGPRRHRTPE